ncbi:MAG: hypothetical protein WBA89_02490 [Microcoleus sp.]
MTTDYCFPVNSLMSSPPIGFMIEKQRLTGYRHRNNASPNGLTLWQR